MRSLKSGLLAFGLAAFFGTAAVIGCSASGEGSDISQDQPGTDPTAGNTNTLPPSNADPPPPPPPDAGKDSGKKDGSVDAGPPPPNPGDACTKVDSLATKPCGACGTQQAICQATDDAGTLKWSDYGQCTNEIAGGCTPTTSQACGNCGTQTCSKYCAWGSCSEPAGACKSGSLDYSTAGCATPNTYRSRSCDNTCKWSGFSTTCAAPNNPNKMTINGTVGQVATSAWTLSASNVGEKLDAFGGCPGTASGASDASYPYVAVEVVNNTGKKATVTIYDTFPTGGSTALDTVMWIYNKTLPPTDDTTLAACDYGVADSCPAGVTCGGSTYDFAGIASVTINAGASVLVYSAGYGSSVTGGFNLAVRTDSLM